MKDNTFIYQVAAVIWLIWLILGIIMSIVFLPIGLIMLVSLLLVGGK